MDDVVPIEEVSAIPDYGVAVEACRRLGLARDPRIWHGDVFRVLLCLRSYHPELEFCTIEGPENAQAVVWKTESAALTVRPADGLPFNQWNGSSCGMYSLAVCLAIFDR